MATNNRTVTDVLLTGCGALLLVPVFYAAYALITGTALFLLWAGLAAPLFALPALTWTQSWGVAFTIHCLMAIFDNRSN
jgi:hypothetical protein